MQGTKPANLAYGLHCRPFWLTEEHKPRLDKLTLQLSDLRTQSVGEATPCKTGGLCCLPRLAAGAPHQPNPNQTSGSLRHESGCTLWHMHFKACMSV
jgi:hypothetical protein